MFQLSNLTDPSKEKLKNYQLADADGFLLTYDINQVQSIEIRVVGRRPKAMSMSPLHAAIDLEDFALVEELVANGANIHAQGRTMDGFMCDAVTRAAGRSYYNLSEDGRKIVHFLLKKFLLDKGKDSILSEEVQSFLKSEKEYKKTLYSILSESALDKLLRSHLFRFNHKYDEIVECGYGSIHYAARVGDTELLKELLEIDAGLVNQKDKQGLTPLDHATDNGKVLAVKFLSEYRSKNVSVDNEAVDRALQLAQTYRNSWSPTLWMWKLWKGNEVDYKKIAEILSSAQSNRKGQVSEKVSDEKEAKKGAMSGIR